jgi:hypothetical protein
MVFSCLYLKHVAKLALFFEIAQYYFDNLAYFPQNTPLKKLKMHKKQNSINNYQKKSFVFLKKVLPLQAKHKICKNNYNSYHSNFKKL